MSLMLAAPPSGTVTIDMAVDITTAVSPSSATLTFTPLNWSTPQIVTFTALQDANGRNENVIASYTINQASTVSEYDAISTKT